MNCGGFIKKSAIAAGLAGSVETPPTLAQSDGRSQQTTGAPPADNRSADYLRRVRLDELLPKPPAIRDSSGTEVKISPMPLAERVERKIVPRRGFCSISPASDALLLSGNGAMSIDTACDPYSEQITFRHESLFTPNRRPFEAPKIASVFPQVRQMLSDGKYHEAAGCAIRARRPHRLIRLLWGFREEAGSLEYR